MVRYIQYCMCFTYTISTLLASINNSFDVNYIGFIPFFIVFFRSGRVPVETLCFCLKSEFIKSFFSRFSNFSNNNRYSNSMLNRHLHVLDREIVLFSVRDIERLEKLIYNVFGRSVRRVKRFGKRVFKRDFRLEKKKTFSKNFRHGHGESRLGEVRSAREKNVCVNDRSRADYESGSSVVRRSAKCLLLSGKQ